MNRRFLFQALTAGLVVLGISARDTNAASVPLPATYAALIGNSTTVVGPETLTFSGFTFSSTSVPPGSEVTAASINVTAFTNATETGFSFGGAGLFAPANTKVDVSISYTVTAPAGELLTDAFLNTTGGSFGGTGSYSVSETLVNPLTNTQIGRVLEGSSPTGSATDFMTFAGVQSIFVTKDIFLNGGSAGETLSVVTQAFSSQTVPEPAGLALLGIGMTGLLAFRRFFKKTSVA
jgi:hypothetical protein